jgi:hypothetical protein
MFYGKEVLGEDIYCEPPPFSPRPGVPERLPAKRELYFHDTGTDLWYHCCEHRQRYSKFMTDSERVRTPKGMSLNPLAALDSFGFGAKKKADPIMNPDLSNGPLLQCNMMTPMKHMQSEKNGGRKVTDEVRQPGAASAMMGPMGSVFRCPGDQGVALMKWAGGTQIKLEDLGLGSSESGTCIDAGPRNKAQTQGKPYAVYELSSAPLLGPLLVPVNPCKSPSCDAKWRVRNAAAAEVSRQKRFGDFL